MLRIFLQGIPLPMVCPSACHTFGFPFNLRAIAFFLLPFRPLLLLAGDGMAFINVNE